MTHGEQRERDQVAAAGEEPLPFCARRFRFMAGESAGPELSGLAGQLSSATDAEVSPVLVQAPDAFSVARVAFRDVAPVALLSV